MHKKLEQVTPCERPLPGDADEEGGEGETVEKGTQRRDKKETEREHVY